MPADHEHAFQAKFDGWCGKCEKRIEAGEWVQYEANSLVHSDCVDTEDIE